MRKLWATGWIHNQIRAITASFLVKFLLIPWTWGMKHFWDTLVDSDLECDILGWQYISGGLPVGHKLNVLDSPEIQGSKYDPDGHYVRTWIPELARTSTEWIHHPWDAPKSIVETSGVELGLNYPKRIVDINTARERLDDAVANMWEFDRASLVTKIGGSTEIVAENSLSMKILNSARLVLNKEALASTSSLDQRVSSFQNLKSTSCRKGSEESDRNKAIKVEINDGGKNTDTSKTYDEDMQSTAESSFPRKKSISRSLFDIPTSSFPSSYGKIPYEFESFKPDNSMGVHLCIYGITQIGME